MNPLLRRDQRKADSASWFVKLLEEYHTSGGMRKENV